MRASDDRQSALRGKVSQKLLQWVNLRPEESERTILMFAFYTVTSIGLLWFEASAQDRFLQGFGSDNLPWIFLASALISSSLGFVYSWLPRVLPLRQVIVLIPLLLSLPLLVFAIGLRFPRESVIGSVTVFTATVLAMRLWQEVISVLNDLNTSITANQLFNIREIKRTFPLISSGVLVADVISGFSLPILISLVGLPNVIIISGLLVLGGAVILFYLSQNYRQFFPDAHRRHVDGGDQPEASTRRVQRPIRRYAFLLFAFFAMAQVLYVLIEFQYLRQLEEWIQGLALGQTLGALIQSPVTGQSSKSFAAQIGIAGFIGLFNGVLGIFELIMQWFASSRMMERLGVFTALLIIPGTLIILGVFSLVGWPSFFLCLVGLKFFDELLHYTLFTSSGPILFQPIPDSVRANLQSLVRGVAEPLSTGATGILILGMIWLFRQFSIVSEMQALLFVVITIFLAGFWLFVTWLLRSRYVGLLVLGAERGQLSISDVDLRQLKRAVIEALNHPGTEADKRSCIELLTHIDPQNVGEVLAGLLPTLSPALQRQSIEAMMVHPNPTYVGQLRTLINQHTLSPEVLAVALRYVWLTEAEPDIRQLRPYLNPEVDPVVRGTASSLILRRGTPRQKAEATNTLRQMLTHKRERERVMGCRALGEAVYMQALRLHIPNLLQDESLRVRCALLEAIAATHLEEYYPSLLKGLYYKSTREAAMRSLVRLENEALPMLITLAEDIHKPDLVRMHSWVAIGKIGTIEAQSLLVNHLVTSWGKTRRNILDVLLNQNIMPQEVGINAVVDRLGRGGIETLIEQELLFMGQIYSALVDLIPELVNSREADLLRRALRDVVTDTTTRLFLLMKLLYPFTAIQAASFNLQSSSGSSIARGLEILDNTLDIPTKQILLSVLDRRSDAEKLQNLSELVAYHPMPPSDRLRYLLELRYFLSDWALACCFHLARQSYWSVTPEQTLSCLRHPTGFIREAVLAYLAVASPRALEQLLPLLKNDPDPLVSAQIKEMMGKLGMTIPSEVTTTDSNNSQDFKDFSGTNDFPGPIRFDPA